MSKADGIQHIQRNELVVTREAIMRGLRQLGHVVPDEAVLIFDRNKAGEGVVRVCWAEEVEPA